MLATVECSNGFLLVTACSKCNATGLAPYTNPKAFINTRVPPLYLGRAFGCRHTVSAIVDIGRSCQMDQEDLIFPILLNDAMLETVEELNQDVELGPGWIFDERIGYHRNGALAIMVSSELAISVYSLKLYEGEESISFYCHQCPSNSCAEAKLAKLHYSSLLPNLNIHGERNKRREYTPPLFPCYSKKPYPINTQDVTSLQLVIGERMKKGSNWFFGEKILQGVNYFYSFPSNRDSFSIYPEKICTCSQGRGRYKVVSNNGVLCSLNSVSLSLLDLLIFLILQTIRMFKVYKFICDECNTEFSYDGFIHGILNFQNRHFFAVEIFYNLYDLKVASGIATYAWWKCYVEFVCKLIENLDYAGKTRRVLGRMHSEVHQYFCQFMGLIQKPDSLYRCCDNPEYITLDGIVISVETKRIQAQKLQTPWVRINPEDMFGKFKLVGRKARAVIHLHKDKLELVKILSKKPGLPVALFNDLIKGNASHPFFVFLKQVVVHVQVRNSDNQNCTHLQVPEKLASFVYSMGKAVAPACGIITPKCFAKVALLGRESPPSLNSVAAAVRTFYFLLLYLHTLTQPLLRLTAV